MLRLDRRRFEWGFVTEAHGSPPSLDEDSTIQTLLKYKHKKLSRESIPPAPFDGGEFSSTQYSINALLHLTAEELETEIKSTRDEAKRQEISFSDDASINNLELDLPRGLQVAFSKIFQQSVEQVGRELVSAEIQDLFERTYFLKEKPRFQLLDYTVNADRSTASVHPTSSKRRDAIHLKRRFEGVLSIDGRSMA